MNFEGKTAYVTGASSGIGRGAAVRLAADGATVVLMGRREALLEEVAGECQGRGRVLVMDVTNGPSVARDLPGAIERFGPPDVVVHAAGETVLGSLDALTEAEWDQQFDTNLKSIYFLNRVLWPAMAANGGGSIVTIASTASFGAFPGDAAYVASKGAVLQLTKAMALDGAPLGIRANAVCPGFILTPNLQGYFDGQADPTAAAAGASAAAPLGRMGSPADVAGAVAFLASDDAAFITGASLLVDGGLLAKVPV